MLVRRLAPRALLIALLGALLTVTGLPVSPASAETTILCRGFDRCNAKGLGNAGYENNISKMWWRMYAGHNCTNYVAYRMVQAGMSATRPWEGSGNASNWGVELADRTDGTPMVGSVAWWRGRNHVQYVERVIDANTIVVSEDHWGGDFNWARVTRDSYNWPDGFIHLRDARVQNTARPTLPGSPQVDEPITGNPGAWTPSGTFSYQWLANGVPIAGATTLTFVPRAAHVAKELSLRVVAHKRGYLSKQVNTVRSEPVAPGDFTTTATPQISGIPKVGATLTATSGTWTPNPTSRSVQWLADGEPIAGATGWSLTLGPDQLDKVIRVVVTARRSGYVAEPTSSAATDPVGPEKIDVSEPARITGTPKYGNTLAIDRGAYGPSTVSFRHAWLRDGKPISGATSRSYTPTSRDLGHLITAQVTYSKPGYTTIRRNLVTPHRVRSTPRVVLRSPAKRTILVRVNASGVSMVNGSVTLRDAYGNAGARKLVDGQAVFQTRWIRAGYGTYTVSYGGSNKVFTGQQRRILEVMGIAR